MIYQDREPQQKNKFLVTPENGTPFYAIIKRDDNPKLGKEGTQITAEVLNDLSSKATTAKENSETAKTASNLALEIVENLTITSTPINCDAVPTVEINTNTENKHKNIHFKIPTSKQGKSYRNCGAWSSTETYLNDDLFIDTVTKFGCTYYCKQTNSNISPADNLDSEYWGLLASRGSNANITIVDNLASEDSNYALSAKQGKALKSITDEMQASLNEISLTVSSNKTLADNSISEIQTQLTTINNTLTQLNSSIQLLQTQINNMLSGNTTFSKISTNEVNIIA